MTSADARAISRTAGSPVRSSSDRPRRGRPRSPDVDQAVLDATTDLLHELGLRGTTMNAIAARSGCAKSTIYRRWATRDSIVLEALRLAVQGRADDIRRVVQLEQELDSTVHAAGRRGAQVFGSPIAREVLPLIMRELVARSPLGERFRTEVFAPIRAAAKVRLGAAIDRGEVAPGVDLDMVFDVIYGTMLYRSLLGGSLDDAAAQVLGDLVLNGVGGPSGRRGGNPGG